LVKACLLEAFANNAAVEPTPAERYAAEQAVRSHAEQCTLPAQMRFVADALPQVRAAASQIGNAMELTGIQPATTWSGIRIGSVQAVAELLAGLRTPAFEAPQQQHLNASFLEFTSRLRSTNGALTAAGRDLLAILQDAATRNPALAQRAQQAEARLRDSGQADSRPASQALPARTLTPAVGIVPAHR
jgi:hypothetical protein